MVNSWQSHFRRAALVKLVNLKFSQFHSLSTALSTIRNGKIWNIVPLWCRFTALTAGFPVDFLYSSAHIGKTEYRFPFMVLNCKKQQNNLNMLQILSASVCCMYVLFCMYASNCPPWSSVVHMQKKTRAMPWRAKHSHRFLLRRNLRTKIPIVKITVKTENEKHYSQNS